MQDGVVAALPDGIKMCQKNGVEGRSLNVIRTALSVSSNVIQKDPIIVIRAFIIAVRYS